MSENIGVKLAVENLRVMLNDLEMAHSVSMNELNAAHKWKQQVNTNRINQIVVSFQRYTTECSMQDMGSDELRFCKYFETLFREELNR